MSVGAGSIKRATASAKPAEAPVEAKESVAAAASKPAAKKTTARKPAAAALKKSAQKKSAPKKPAQTKSAAPKTAVITGANPDIEFYHISEDLPIHLL